MKGLSRRGYQLRKGKEREYKTNDTSRMCPLLQDCRYFCMLRRCIDISAIGLLHQGFPWLLLGHLLSKRLPYGLDSSMELVLDHLPFNPLPYALDSSIWLVLVHQEVSLQCGH